ncbi:MAG: hypothetical protein Q8K67_02405 [Geothrix sp.]|nr:hypothetical protein [Geothrix sp.]
MDPTADYLKALSSALAKGDATEHTHRPALKTYLEALAPGITATNEPRRIAWPRTTCSKMKSAS